MLVSPSPSADIPLDLILIRPDRQRREFTTEDLEESIPRRGLINPLLIHDLGDGTYELVAGERRLETLRKLGWPSAPCRFDNTTSPLERKMLELEENIKRRDLTWQDNMAALEELHSLHLEEDAEWTRQQTAEAIGLSNGHVSNFLNIAEAAKAKPELLSRKTYREAYNVIKRAESRANDRAFEELFETVKEGLSPEDRQTVDAARSTPPPEPPKEILNLSFLEWAPSYEGEKFNFIHCDFPYGVDLFAKEFGNRGGAKPYADSPDIYFALLNCLLDNFERFASLSTHLMFWYSPKFDRDTKELFRMRLPSMEIVSYPLIWGKSDNAGIIGDARRDYRRTYEMALFGRRGERQVVKSVAALYNAPTDTRLHPSAKPEPMLRHFMSALVDEHTAILDPTCGAGSALRAADSLGASRLLGLEIDEDYCGAAQTELKNARTLRRASKLAE